MKIYDKAIEQEAEADPLQHFEIPLLLADNFPIEFWGILQMLSVGTCIIQMGPVCRY